MNISNACLPGGVSTRTLWMSLALFTMTLALAACGGTGTTANDAGPPTATACVPSDPSTAAECGTLIVGLTDADGDFLSYTIDVLSLELEKRDGSVISVLPRSTRVDFAQYVDLTEFITVATVPPGDYVAGRIRLDYSDAEVFVEADGLAKAALVVDEAGTALARTELEIRLADRDHLLIFKGRPALLTLDFDLDASHTVDVAPMPAIATAEPFIVAELDPVDTKDIRVRGHLVEANVDEMYYTVAVRPFFDAAGDFGRLKVNVTDRTDFEVNEQAFVGVEGLRALNAAGQGTLTVAKGTLNVANREFTAHYVIAGSSVPGNGMDAVRGNVIARSGNELVVRGGTVILSDSDRAFFRDDVTVTVGPDTVVYKAFATDRPLGMPMRLLDISAISVGQAVTIRGDVVVNDELGVHIDASQGTVAMHLTHLFGTVNTIMPGQVDIDLHAIDRRRVEVFDFTGTGASPAMDADPDNYEVATGNLPMLASDNAGQPVVVYGFAHEFGAAPPDFEGRTIIDYSDVRSALGVGWGAEGTTAPFLMMDGSGLLLDNMNPDIDQRHHIKQGPVLIDLATLDSNTLIAPRESGRMLFTIKTTDSLQLYADFDDFVGALTLELDGVSAA
ncbi:MAG: hypothetical protein OEV41_10015, partial [Gammaproteobacteria bacterium]|nr:hypothetical protein [Gammaproteobacteria bacterium]